MTIRVGILTVSDTASVDPTADKSGPTIRQIVVSQYECDVTEEHCRIVADDVESIRAAVRSWCDEGTVDWIITTGGTGFGVRDVTPEAISPLIDRPASGLVHLLLSSSLQKTPFAALSRPVAGTIKHTMVTTLPGSVKAVTENLTVLLEAGVMKHAIDLIKGGSGRQLHSAMVASPSEVKFKQPGSARTQEMHHHHHHHHQTPVPRSSAALSHDPSAPASRRHRKSPYPIIPLEQAFSILHNVTQQLPTQMLPVDHNLNGYVLAEDVHAPYDIPTRPTTSVDGYALLSSCQPGKYKVLTSTTHAITKPLPSGCVYRINTGGPLPEGTDAVIMVEDTQLVSTHDTSATDVVPGDEKEIATLAQVPVGENVRATGSDVRKGEVVMREGERIFRTGGEIGTLAFVGRKKVLVYKKPVVALLSTGNELVDLQGHGSEPLNDGWGGIFDTNRPTLHTALVGLGYEVLDLGIVPDDIHSHVEALNQGLKSADVVLTTGGTSMGPTDLLKPVIERYLNGTVHFGRVSVKPGKPTTFATAPFKDGNTTNLKPIFALPGNPASALVTFYVFVLPTLRKMGGWPEHACLPPKVTVQIQNTMHFDPRIEFHRVVIRSTANTGPNTPVGNNSKEGPCLKAYSTGGQRSSRAGSLCGANGLVLLPPLETAGHGGRDVAHKTRLDAGEFAQALVIGEIEMTL